MVSNQTSETQSFTEQTMPEPGRSFVVVWPAGKYGDAEYEGNLNIWLKFIAMYGYPQRARWRYSEPNKEA